jgi:hypothetical protein
MNNNRDLFTGNLTAEPELNRPSKGIAVVNASLANNELYTSEGGERQQITKVLHVGPRASRVAMRARNRKIPFSPCRYLNLLDLHSLETLAEWTGKAAVLVSLCGQVAHATPPYVEYAFVTLRSAMALSSRHTRNCVRASVMAFARLSESGFDSL